MPNERTGDFETFLGSEGAHTLSFNKTHKGQAEVGTGVGYSER